jgi:hypothetical protein
MRSHCGVEVTEFSTNSQPYLSNTHLRCCSLGFIIISLFFNYYFEQLGRRLSPLLSFFFAQGSLREVSYAWFENLIQVIALHFYYIFFCTGKVARSGVFVVRKPHPSYRPTLLRTNSPRARLRSQSRT